MRRVSDGRLIFGLGAGRRAPEFAALGLSMQHRVDRFAEAMSIVTGLLRGERLTFSGQHHEVLAAELLPAPTRRVPVLVAAARPRMLRLTARYADAWNIAWDGVPDVTSPLADLRHACAAGGRDPATLTVTVGVRVHDAGSDEPPDPDDDVLSGSAEEVARAFDGYDALGVDHLIGSRTHPPSAP